MQIDGSVCNQTTFGQFWAALGGFALRVTDERTTDGQILVYGDTRTHLKNMFRLCIRSSDQRADLSHNKVYPEIQT